MEQAIISSFADPLDLRKINSDVFLTRVRESFNKTPFNFNLYFLNSKAAAAYVEVGEVHPEWLHKHLPNVYNTLEQDDVLHDKGITIIFTNNVGTDRLSLTPWIIAHRIGHALAAENKEDYVDMLNAITVILRNLIQSAYNVDNDPIGNKMAFNMLRNIVKFKSAGMLSYRWGETTHEFRAQFILNGKVTFKNLPTTIGDSQSSYSLIYPKDRNKFLLLLQHRINEFISYKLREARGRIFVM